MKGAQDVFIVSLGQKEQWTRGSKNVEKRRRRSLLWEMKRIQKGPGTGYTGGVGWGQVLMDVGGGRERRKEEAHSFGLFGKTFKKCGQGASLVVQQLRSHLAMQGTRVQPLIREDPSCRGATKPVYRNCCAHTV